MSEAETDRYRAPALDKGLDILELLARTADGLSQAEIAKSLDRSPNEIYRMLDRLVRRDYVRRTPEDRYEITLKLFELAHVRPPLHRLINQATPILRDFSIKADQAVHLVVQDRHLLVVVAQFDSPGYWNVSIRVGSRLDLTNTGSGHVFLAYSPPHERTTMLAAQHPDRVETLSEQLLVRLDQIAEQGHESMPSAQTPGVFNLSVPIFGPLGSVQAVITSPYSQRLDRPDAPDMEAVLTMLKHAGKAITNTSEQSGGQTP